MHETHKIARLANINLNDLFLQNWLIIYNANKQLDTLYDP